MLDMLIEPVSRVGVAEEPELVTGSKILVLALTTRKSTMFPRNKKG